MEMLNKIFGKINIYNKPFSTIYVNFKNYNLIQEEVQKLTDLDYETQSIKNLELIHLVVDQDLADDEILLQ